MSKEFLQAFVATNILTKLCCNSENMLAAFPNQNLSSKFPLLLVCNPAGYVQKITARKDIELMEDLDNGKPL